ncbi:MAG: glycosyltransferase family 2 protein [Bacteroidaceae bacterium]|nr:glycosyltransferase family 2 protein [Bacteroidaceae bacterium]
MKIAIIILNYNSSADCRKCIGYLKAQQGVEQEIVVVDNCSREEDCKAVELLCKEQGCTFIANNENRGYNAGNNVGLRYAAEKGYEYALIANPDMEFPQTDYLATVLAKMQEEKDIVVCGSDIVGADGIHQSPMGKEGNWRGSFGWIKNIFSKRKKSDAYDFIDNNKESHYCHKVSGCCFMIRTAFLKEINFFDEKVFLYCEEAILSRQVELAGKQMYYLATAQAVHRHVKIEKGDPVRRFKVWGKSRCYFIDHYSNDHWFGKQLAKLSMKMYVAVFTLYNKIKK